jgi:hypothetical protein
MWPRFRLPLLFTQKPKRSASRNRGVLESSGVIRDVVAVLMVGFLTQLQPYAVVFTALAVVAAFWSLCAQKNWLEVELQLISF